MNISTDFEKTLLVKIAMKKSEKWLDEHLFSEIRSSYDYVEAIVFERKINNMSVLISFMPIQCKTRMLMYEKFNLASKEIGEMIIDRTNLESVENHLEEWFKIAMELKNVQ